MAGSFTIGMAFPLLAAYQSAGQLQGLSFRLDKKLADLVSDPGALGRLRSPELRLAYAEATK